MMVVKADRPECLPAYKPEHLVLRCVLGNCSECAWWPVVARVVCGVCMSWIFYLATCGPKGHGSGLPLPSRTAAFSSPPLND